MVQSMMNFTDLFYFFKDMLYFYRIGFSLNLFLTHHMRYGMVRTESWLFQDPRMSNLCQRQRADILEDRSIKLILKDFGILLFF